jgi:hypothetical protein
VHRIVDCDRACGCASTQLNYNTVDIAGNVESIYVRQALANLSRTIDDPTAVPSQIDIAAGTAQTSNSLTPGFTSPITPALTRSGAGVTTSTAIAGAGFTFSGNDAWQQSWTISPVTDGNNLRNLRALYRYVVIPTADLRREYHPSVILQKGRYILDPYALRKPHCVLCTPALIPNEHLQRGWLFWSSDDPEIPERLPPQAFRTVYLGHWGRHNLYMTAFDYERGYLNDFVLFIMGTGPGPGDQSAGGKGGGGGGGGAASKRFELIIPQQIQPQQQ